MLRSALLTTSALAALLLAGCGDSGRLSKSDYEQRVRSVYANVQEAFRKTNVASTKLLADRVEQPATAYDNVACPEWSLDLPTNHGHCEKNRKEQQQSCFHERKR